MDADQKALRKMGDKVQVTLTSSSGQYTGYIDMEAEKVKFDLVLEDWDKLIEEEEAETQSDTANKKAKKEDMANYWDLVGSTGATWAIDNEPGMEGDWRHSKSEIFHTDDVEAGKLCAHIYETMKPLVGGMGGAGITLEILDTGKDKTKAFVDLINAPQQVKDAKTVAGANIDKLIDERFRPSLKKLDGYVNGIYFITKQKFVDLYNQSRVIDNFPSHATVISVVFRDSVTGDLIKGAKVRDVREKGKTGVSDVMGVAMIEHFRGGKNLEFELSCAGYVTQMLVRSIKQGKHLEVEVSMVKV